MSAWEAEFDAYWRPRFAAAWERLPEPSPPLTPEDEAKLAGFYETSIAYWLDRLA